MLTKEELGGIAKFTGLKIYQQEKHYIQTIILHSIYSTITNELVFKGGTALSFLHGLNRFSEDLDFTLVKEFEIEKMIKSIDNELTLLGINHNTGKIKEDKTSISFRIGAEGPLFSKEIERCYVSIEISKREKVVYTQVNEIKTFYSDLPAFSIVSMAEKEILAEKVRALLTRNYARDLYDLYFLLTRKVSIDINLINEKLSYYNKSFNKADLRKKIIEKKEIWESELNSIIIGNLPSFNEIKNLIYKFLIKK